MTVRRATLADRPALTALAARTFERTFAATNTRADMDAYLAAHFGAAQQQAELADPHVATLLVDLDGTLAGYAQLREGPAEPCVSGARPIELVRFYLDEDWQGRGLAPALMAAVHDEARGRGAETLWLGVWEHNQRALRFYTRQGFVDVGSHVFMVGADRQIDRIMARPVAAAPAPSAL